ncbi:MAG: Glutamate/gamma-aminobutyrate antiporter [Chlamydiae bacterium]|nr:Glutamate/gamma-aminobutyrate antiporter [Chlamydiota bacterium]
MSKKKALGFFQLVMINVIAVDSIRTLPFSAVYGFSLVFFYLIAALVFFIPTALVSAELGTGWPNRGGIYVWVREAFGKKVSFLVIWLNWVYNVFWFPTILALIAGTFTYFFNPELASNPLYMTVAVLVLFWGATLVNCLGMRASSILSTLGALIGTIFPMILIGGMGILWIILGNKMEIILNWEDFIPKREQLGNLAFLTNVFFGLLGLEMAATHAREMRNPAKDYPKSIFTSVGIILGTIILASLAIAVVVPMGQLSLAIGIMQAFTIFFHAYGIPWAVPLIAGCIVLGGLSGVGAWIIGPTKGLLVASQDGSLPAFFAKTNKHQVPVRILMLQAIVVSLLAFVYVIFPTINKSFWLLSVITAQLAMLVYIALFASAIKLSYTKADVPRRFQIPGKKFGIWSVCSVGAVSCLIVFLLGFLPPEQILYKNVLVYELILVGGMSLACFIPFLIYRRKFAKK